MPQLFINGEHREINAQDIASLCAELGLAAPLLLVEYNAQALSRSEWDQVRLSDGDSLELLSVAAGG